MKAGHDLMQPSGLHTRASGGLSGLSAHFGGSHATRIAAGLAAIYLPIMRARFDQCKAKEVVLA
jgi:hypothetical protein